VPPPPLASGGAGWWCPGAVFDAVLCHGSWGSFKKSNLNFQKLKQCVSIVPHLLSESVG